ncbi:hypothetical protein DITRI_Ditri20bG0047800 [Diplodiscus trichospermus]
MGSASRKTFLPLDPVSSTDESKAVIDFIADYYKNIEKYPVQSRVEPGYLSARLPYSTPYCPESLEVILKDVNDCIVPVLTHWQSPNFFGYFQANASTAGFLGDMLCSGFNVVGFNWIASPAATELESLVLDWIDKILKLPSSFLFSGTGGGVLHGSTCEAAVCTLAAARDKALKELGGFSMSPEKVRSAIEDDMKSGSACICPELRHYLDGVEHANSVSMNPHKWHGVDNLMHHIQSDISMAKRFEAFVAKNERFETVVRRNFALVCFRLKPKQESEGTELNCKLLDAINSSGRAFMTNAVIGGIYVIRCTIGTTLTEEHHVDALWKLI